MTVKICSAANLWACTVADESDGLDVCLIDDSLMIPLPDDLRVRPGIWKSWLHHESLLYLASRDEHGIWRKKRILQKLVQNIVEK